MSEPILLSILIPSIPSRAAKLQELLAQVGYQVGFMPIEIIALTDNKKRSIGMKREALIQLAQGLFLAFLDDDDEASTNYCRSLATAIRDNPDADVISFVQHVDLDGQHFHVDFNMEHPVEQAQLQGCGWYKNIKRKPWTCCAWRTELAKTAHFPDNGLEEDFAWLQQLWPLVQKEVHLSEVLHTYRYRSALSEGDQTIQARLAQEAK